MIAVPIEENDFAIQVDETNLLALKNEKSLFELMYNVDSNKIAMALCRTLDFSVTGKPMTKHDIDLINQMIEAFLEIECTQLLELTKESE